MDMRIFCLRMNLLCDKINGSKQMIMIILVMSSGYELWRYGMYIEIHAH